jgi:hypothetical protein
MHNTREANDRNLRDPACRVWIEALRRAHTARVKRKGFGAESRSNVTIS